MLPYYQAENSWQPGKKCVRDLLGAHASSVHEASRSLVHARCVRSQEIGGLCASVAKSVLVAAGLLRVIGAIRGCFFSHEFHGLHEKIIVIWMYSTRVRLCPVSILCGTLGPGTVRLREHWGCAGFSGPTRFSCRRGR